MPTPFVQVIVPDGAPQFVELPGEHSVVGSSITCQVVVERPGFAREHMLLSPRSDGCYVAIAKGAPSPVHYKNEVIERATIPWGSELVVAGVRFVLHDGSVSRSLAAAATAPGARSANEKPKVSPVVVIASLVMLPLAGWFFLLSPDENLLGRSTVQPPALFDSFEQPCPQTDLAAARLFAAESARQAIAKAERLPFETQDGIEAVRRYAIASACFRAVEQVQRADTQLATGRALAARIDDEFRNHRFRLERALEQSRPQDALVETRLLKNYVTHRRGPYLTWLMDLERRLALQIDQAATAR